MKRKVSLTKALKLGSANLQANSRSGIRHFNGRLDMEISELLRHGKDLKLYQEMVDTDAVVGSIVYLIETWLKRASWRVEPAIQDDERAGYWARFIESALFEDMSHTWEDNYSNILQMIWAGFFACEEVHKIRVGPNEEDPSRRSRFSDGLIGWRKFAPINPLTVDSWVFDDQGGIQGLVQRDHLNFERVQLPISKLLLFRVKNVGNLPSSRSMLRSAVRSYVYLKKTQSIECAGIERDLSGYPTMEVPLEMFSDDNAQVLEQMRQIVTNIRRDNLEGAVLPASIGSDGQPTGFKFALVTSGGSRAINLDQTIRRYEQRIAMSVLCEFVLLGTDNTGSFSMHSSKTNVFAVALTALLDNIASVFNRFAIPRLMRLNGAPPEYDPYLVHGDLAPPPFEQIAQYVSTLANANMLTPDPRIERKLREYASLPEMDDDLIVSEEVPTDEAALAPTATATATAATPPAAEPGADDAANAYQVRARVSSIVDLIASVRQGTVPMGAARVLLERELGLTPQDVDRLLADVTVMEPTAATEKAPS